MKKNQTTVILLIVIMAVLWVITERPMHLKQNSIEDFPVMTQPDEISCGPTSCAMIIKYYTDENPDIELIKKYAKTTWYSDDDTKIGMTIPNYIKIALSKYGIQSEIKRGNLDILKASVDKNKPPIVLLRSGPKYWHYVVVIGYDENKIIIADPAGGATYEIANDIFLDAWSFKKTMTGEDPKVPCPFCKNGQIGGVPTNFTKCDYCGGSGKVDHYLKLVNLTDVSIYTTIIPNYP